MATAKLHNYPTTGFALIEGNQLNKMVSVVNSLNQSFGTFTANSNIAVTVADTNVGPNSIIIPTLKTVGGTVGASVPAVKTITVGVGFTITALASDTSVYNYMIINPTLSL
jgi:hypothetical protein